MNCKKYKKQILSYLDGELHQEMANELNEHLKVCESCRIEVEKLGIAYNLIEDEKAEFKSDSFMSVRVLAKLTRTKLSTSPNNYSLRYLTIASLAAAGLTIGILIGTLYSSTTSTTYTSITVQEWDQLADEYMPEVENNPYKMVTITNEIPQKP